MKKRERACPFFVRMFFWGALLGTSTWAANETTRSDEEIGMRYIHAAKNIVWDQHLLYFEYDRQGYIKNFYIVKNRREIPSGKPLGFVKEYDMMSTRVVPLEWSVRDSYPKALKENEKHAWQGLQLNMPTGRRELVSIGMAKVYGEKSRISYDVNIVFRFKHKEDFFTLFYDKLVKAKNEREDLEQKILKGLVYALTLDSKKVQESIALTLEDFIARVAPSLSTIEYILAKKAEGKKMKKWVMWPCQSAIKRYPVDRLYKRVIQNKNKDFALFVVKNRRTSPSVATMNLFIEKMEVNFVKLLLSRFNVKKITPHAVEKHPLVKGMQREFSLFKALVDGGIKSNKAMLDAIVMGSPLITNKKLDYIKLVFTHMDKHVKNLGEEHLIYAIHSEDAEIVKVVDARCSPKTTLHFKDAFSLLKCKKNDKILKIALKRLASDFSSTALREVAFSVIRNESVVTIKALLTHPKVAKNYAKWVGDVLKQCSTENEVDEILDKIKKVKWMDKNFVKLVNDLEDGSPEEKKLGQKVHQALLYSHKGKFIFFGVPLIFTALGTPFGWETRQKNKPKKKKKSKPKVTKGKLKNVKKKKKLQKEGTPFLSEPKK